MDDLTKTLITITRELLLTEIEDLETAWKENDQQIKRAESIGFILDPTGYRNAIQNGEMENAKLQNDLVSHLIEARRVIEKLNDGVKLQILGLYRLDEDGNAIPILEE